MNDYVRSGETQANEVVTLTFIFWP